MHGQDTEVNEPQRLSGRLRQWESHTHAQGGYKTLPYVYYGGAGGAAPSATVPALSDAKELHLEVDCGVTL